MRFKQTIQISKTIEGIFKLPCIAAIRKDIFGAPFFDTYGFLMYDGNSGSAREGDWLCEDYDNKWHLLSNEEYKELNN